MKKKPAIPRPPAVKLRILAAEEIPSIFPLIKLHNPGMTRRVFNVNLKEMLPQGYSAVGAFAGERLVGVSGFWLRSRFWCGRQLDVDNFFILPEFRRGGLGSRMMEWLEQKALAEQCSLMVLDVYGSSHLAQRFYHRQGFVITGYHFTKVPGTSAPFVVHSR